MAEVGWGGLHRTEGWHDAEVDEVTVWPHDNALIAAGLRRYGYGAEAARISKALLDAATYFQYRLPGVFAGYPRVLTCFPVEYPTASSPQAWAAGTTRSSCGCCSVSSQALRISVTTPSSPMVWTASP